MTSNNTSSHRPSLPHWSELTFADLWHHTVDHDPERVFLLTEGQEFTYAQVDAAANSFAHGLHAAGVMPGTRVALLLLSDMRLLQLQLAIQKLGAVMVPLIHRSTAREVAYVLRHSSPSLVITDGDGWPAIGAGQPEGLEAGEVPLTYVFGGETGDHRPGAELQADRYDRPADSKIEPDSPMAIMYTSGSTGRPKGVLQPNHGYAATAMAIAERLDTGPDDVYFCALPLFHSAGTHIMLGPALASGARFALTSQFSRSIFWQEVRRTGGTVTLLMPAQMAILCTAPPAEGDSDNPLRLLISHLVNDEFCARFAVQPTVGWSMSESSGLGALSAPGDPVPSQYVGHPMVNMEVKVVGPDGTDVPDDEDGELCLKHPGMMLGYLNDQENTTGTMRDGWLHTGDLGFRDTTGGVYFRGRIKNVIKRAGENIAGEEVENCILEHPAVVDCVSCGVPDPIYTEELHVTVTTAPDSRLTEHDVVDWAAARLSSWKVPRYVRLLHADLPRLPNGKIDRMAVKAAADPATSWDGGTRSRSMTTVKERKTS